MANEAGKRTYSAFISYRHAEKDSRVAREIHRKLERYHLDRDVQKRSGRKSLAPVFRDEDELPISSALDDDLVDALRNSTTLIVVCSPRTNESQWVAREIDEFLKTHDQSHVLVALAEGEPHDVVPPRLLKKKAPDGTLVDVEPLAANFRDGCTGAARRNEVTRLVAGILGIPYDSLVRRAQRRRQRIAAALGSVAVAATTAFGVYNAFMNARITANYQQAMLRRSEYLATEANQLLSEGNTIGATELALASLPDSSQPETLERPVVPSAVYALQRATNAGLCEGVVDQSFTTSEAYPAPADLRDMDSSPNGAYLALVDETEVVSLWDVAEHTVVYQGRSTLGKYEALVDAFVLDSGRMIVVYGTGVVCLEPTGETVWDVAYTVDTKPIEVACLGGEGESRLLVASSNDTIILDVANGEAILSLSLSDLPEIQAHEATWTVLMGAPIFAGQTFALPVSYGGDEGFTGSVGVLIDVQSGEVRAFELPGLYAYRFGMLSDGSLVALLGTDPMAMASNRKEALATIVTSTHDFDVTLACIDDDTGETRWSRVITSWQVSFDVGFGETVGYEEDGVPGALVCWLADRVIFVDEESGEVLRELKSASSLVGGGILNDGNSFMGIQMDGSLFITNQQSDNVDAVSLLGGDLYHAEILPSGGFLLMKDNYVYAYRGTVTDETVTRVAVEPFGTSWEYPAKDGFLVVTMSNERDQLRVELRDALSLDRAWEEVFGDGNLLWIVLAFDPDADVLLLESMDYVDDHYVTNSIVRIRVGEHLVETLDVVTGEEAGVTVPQAGEGPSEPLSALVVGNAACYRNGIVYSQVTDKSGTVGIAALSLDTGETTLYAAPEGFGSETDRGDRRLYLHPDPTGTWLVCQDVKGSQQDDSGLVVHYTDIINLSSGECRPLPVNVATLWDGANTSAPLKGSLAWSNDGKTLVCVSPGGIAIVPMDSTADRTIELDGRRVEATYLMGDRVIVGLSSGFSATLESYRLSTGEPLATAHIDDGSSWTTTGWAEVPPELAADHSGGLFVTSGAYGYLVDPESLIPCQRFAGGCAYHREYDALLSRGVERTSYAAHTRYSLMRLVDRGHLVLGPQTMGEEWLAAHGAL